MIEQYKRETIEKQIQESYSQVNEVDRIKQYQKDIITIGINQKIIPYQNLNGIKRIYDMDRGIIIDANFFNSHANNAEVYQNEKVIKFVQIDKKLQLSGQKVKEIVYEEGIKTQQYKGNYKIGMRNGKGVCSLEKQRDQQIVKQIYQGFWVNNKKNGLFKITASTDNKYEYLYARYRNNIKIGKYTYLRQEGNFFVSYQGQFLQNGKVETKNYEQPIQEEYYKIKKRCEQQNEEYWERADKQQKNKKINLIQSEKNIKISIQQLQKTLKAQQMLSSQICNLFVQCLFRSQNKCPQFYIFPQKFMMTISEVKYTYQQTKYYTQVLKGQHCIFNNKWRKIIFPYSIDYNHFSLFVVQLKDNKVLLRHYNSLKKIYNEKYYKQLKIFLINYYEDQTLVPQKYRSKMLMKSLQQLQVNQSQQGKKQIPQQNDGISCGVYMCYFMHCIAFERQIKPFQPQQYRKFIYKVIMNLINKKQLNENIFQNYFNKQKITIYKYCNIKDNNENQNNY